MPNQFCLPYLLYLLYILPETFAGNGHYLSPTYLSIRDQASILWIERYIQRQLEASVYWMPGI